MLRLVEEMLLLLLRDEDGAFVPVRARSLRHAIAGSVLMDLAVENRIDTDLENLFLIDASPVGDSFLDPTLAEIAAAEPQDTRFWVDHIAVDAETIHGVALSSLVARGILKPEMGGFLRLFRARRYPEVDGKARIEARRRIRGVLLTDEIPDPRDVMIICLAQACGILKELLSGQELVRALPRVAQIRRMDLIGQALTRTIEHVESAITFSLGPTR